LVPRQDASNRTEPSGSDQVAAGFFFVLDFAGFGAASACGARSIELKRPAVKV
jgi:hypothetical protein